MKISGIAIGALGLGLSASLASCSSPEATIASADAVTGSTTPTPSPEPVDPTTWSLTGLPDKQDGKRRPVFVVKMDNTQSSWPQEGLSSADLVVQEPVEGGTTRLAAFFESNAPELIGPVRSIRTSDMGFVKPANGTLVASGGSPIALATAQRSGVTVLEEGAEGFFRSPARSAPYNLMVNLRTIRKNGAGKPAEKSYLSFGDFSARGGKKARTVDVTFSPFGSEQWRYEKKSAKWIRQGGGGAFSADALIALRVPLLDAGYKDPAGNFVPEVKTTGAGTGWLVVKDRLRRIKWSKKSKTARWKLTTNAGDPIELPVGKSWISLLSNETGSVASSK